MGKILNFSTILLSMREIRLFSSRLNSFITSCWVLTNKINYALVKNILDNVMMIAEQAVVAAIVHKY